MKCIVGYPDERQTVTYSIIKRWRFQLLKSIYFLLQLPVLKLLYKTQCSHAKQTNNKKKTFLKTCLQTLIIQLVFFPTKGGFLKLQNVQQQFSLKLCPKKMTAPCCIIFAIRSVKSAQFFSLLLAEHALSLLSLVFADLVFRVHQF